MSSLIATLVLVPAATLLLVGLLSFPYANRNSHVMRRVVTWLAGLQCAASALAALLMLPSLVARGEILSWAWPAASPLSASLYFDGFACLMLWLVSFVGFVVCCYSIRYLDGEQTQGRYFHWVSLTVGAVSLLVVSGNLAMLFLAWLLTSLGLHQLLLHYPERKAARRAAWTKFAISRVGDVFLLAAIVLVFREFGSLELSEIFTALKSSSAPATGATELIAWLVVLGAVTKSAQFPVHIWLPETMETPTPVSALMHAGVVNAGGYLVIRMSPLIVEAPAALAALALIGTVTLGFAGVVMLTQSSIKRALAYSTIAQMGFMMLQCGLGAFAPAMLHILAHSLYKAHAFLNSGNVLVEAAGRRKATPHRQFRHEGLTYLPAAVAVAWFSVLGGAALVGIELFAKAGGIVLGFVLTLALATWLWDVLKLNAVGTTLAGALVAFSLSVFYMAGFFLVDRVVSASVPEFTSVGYANTAAALLVLVVFCGLFGLHWCTATDRGRAWLEPLRIHAANGFYIDVLTRRMFTRIQTN